MKFIFHQKGVELWPYYWMNLECIHATYLGRFLLDSVLTPVETGA